MAAPTRIHSSGPRDVSRETASGRGVSRETLARLNAFVSLLKLWNKRINLVADSEEAALWSRHIDNSLSALPLIGQPQRAIDLGSGAGFPGLVLAIASGVTFDLIESDSRKAAFLREAIRVTEASAQVHAARIEAGPVKPADLVTARALAPLRSLLALSAPLIVPGGMRLFFKGRSANQELMHARASWHIDARCYPDNRDGVLVVIREAHPVAI